MDIFDDLGSILYIVFTLGAIIFGTIKKQRKKYTAPEQTETSPNPFEEIKRIFDEQPDDRSDFREETEVQFPEEEELDNQPEEVYSNVKPEEEGKAATFDYNEFHKYYEKNKDRIEEESSDQIAKTFNTAYGNQQETKKKRKFNLRQAIIYDAILNRPYQ